MSDTNPNTLIKQLRGMRACLSFAVLFLTCACTHYEVPDKQHFINQGLPASHVIDDVPVIAQKHSYCGPAALASVLQFNGDTTTQDQAAEMVFTPGRTGTFQHDIVSAIQRRGFMALPVNNTDDLIANISDDRPVIIFQNLAMQWYPMWHYSVVSGYDLNAQTLHVHTGKDTARTVPIRTIGKTWDRAGYWGYVAAPPNDPPAYAKVEDILQAGVRFERAGDVKNAQTTYMGVLKNEPNNPDALFAMGNVAMAKKDYKYAVLYYRGALSSAPDHLYAANNLAYAYSRKGEKASACKLLMGYSKRNDLKQKAGYNEIADSYHELCRRKS